jgi:hypothetical protein
MKRRYPKFQPKRQHHRLIRSKYVQTPSKYTRANLKSNLNLVMFLALLTILSVIFFDFLNPDRDRKIAPDIDDLIAAKELGSGISSMLLEKVHNDDHYGGDNFTVDSSLTFESLQNLADQLDILIDVREALQGRNIRALTILGMAFPPSISEALSSRYEEEVRLVFDTSAMLNWLVMEGYIVSRYMYTPHLTESYATAYPKLVKEINKNFKTLGINESLSEERSSDQDKVAELCWELDELLQKFIENEPDSLLNL